MPLYQPQLNEKTQLWVNDQNPWVEIRIRVTSEYPTGDPIMEQMPWSYTLNGVRDPWRTARIMPNVWTTLGKLYVPTSQTVTVHIGETGTSEIAGPHDYSFYAVRGAALSVGRITQGSTSLRAIPYVNVQGVWRVAEGYAKHEGTWKQTI